MNDCAELWWEKITGPKTIIDFVEAGLENQCVVVISIPFDLPWRNEMRSSVAKKFKYGYSISTIDVADEYHGEKPGNFLLNTMTNDKSIQLNYRSGLIQEYLIANNVLTNKLLWIKGLKTKDAQEWIDFCKKYVKINRNDCLFVIETYGDTSFINTKSDCIKNVVYNDRISSYDVQLFNGFILDSSNAESVGWKKYISSLAASLCDTDAEISYELIKITDFKSESPLDGLEKIINSGEYNLRGLDEASGHILYHYRNNNVKELNSRIWSAQLQVLFPLIELERTKIIEHYYDWIQEALVSEIICQYETPIKKPEEVELGTLDYLVRSQRVWMPDETTRSRISFLHYCRNEIAHMGCISPNEIVRLIDTDK